MADFSALKTSIQNYIKQNGNEEITGNLLQQILLSMVSTLGDSAINDLVAALNAEIANRGNADTELGGRITTLQGVVNGIVANIENGYVYAGIATPSTTPASGKVFYLALTAGTYTNFGATVVPQGINILKYNGSAWSLDSFLGLDDAPTQGSSNLVKSGGVLDSIIKDGSAFDLSAYNNGTTYADLSAALTALNALQAVYKKGGMSIKYVQSSDNKYIQTRCMAQNFTTDVTQWQGVDDEPTTGSDNLVKSGGVKNALNEKVDIIPGNNLINPDAFEVGKHIDNNGSIGAGAGNEYGVSGYISVNEQDIISNCETRNFFAGYNVYNASKTRIRTISGSQQYTYQEGDAFVRIGFFAGGASAKAVACANYGTTLLPYEPYTQFAPLNEIANKLNKSDVVQVTGPNESKVMSQAAVTSALNGKVTVIPGNNLINPNELQIGYFITSGGVVGSAAESEKNKYAVSGYISVNEQNIISNCDTRSFVGGYNVYNASKTRIRTISGSQQYTYQEGDAFVRIGFFAGAPIKINSTLANYGTTLLPYEAYTEYAPVDELRKRVDQIAPVVEQLVVDFIPNCLYTVNNDINVNRNYALKLYLSHLLANTYCGQNIRFSGKKRFIPVKPADVSVKTENSTNITFEYFNNVISTKIRTSVASGSASNKPRILVIGDSVTIGYGAGSNKDVSWLPNTYWAYAKMFFELDKVDAGGTGHEALFTGLMTAGHNIQYEGQTHYIKACCVAEGGKALQDLFTASAWSSAFPVNPFYDSVNQTFSINAYLSKYRTMDDAGVRLVSQSADPHGETVTGSDGLTYQIGTEVTTQQKLNAWDVCKPSHIVINLCHNTTLENYQANIGNVISIIRTELGSDVVICLMTIDETGTQFVDEYPNYIASQITMGSLHSKNSAIYNYIKNNVENEENNVYLLGGQFTQPTAKSFPFVELNYTDDAFESNEETMKVHNTAVSGANYHPNNYAHRAFGYSLYAFLKWVL